MLDPTKVRVGVVYWQAGDETASLISRTSTRLGCEVVEFLFDAPLPPDLNVVLAHGPFGSLVPLANQLISCPPAQRPAFIFLLTEQLPNPAWPEWFRYGAGLLRSHLERLAYAQQAGGDWQPRPRLRWLTATAHRFRYYGDLYWLHRQGVLSVLAIPSNWTAAFLRARGFDPIAPCLSGDPASAIDLNLRRDIPVLWLGKIATARRRRLLAHLRTELKKRNVELLVIDGVEQPYVFGPERTVLLNRTKIVLNLLRAAWDDNSKRFVLATQSRALVVTEPTLPHTPFRPGVHLVEVPLDQIADTICYYLTHANEREQIVEQAHNLITSLTPEKLILQLLNQAVMARQNLSFQARRGEDGSGAVHNYGFKEIEP